MSAVEKFPILLSEAEEESSAVPPCFSDEGINVCNHRGEDPQYEHYSDDCLVPLHSTQQSLSSRTHKTKHKCGRDPPISPQDRRGFH